MFTRTLLTFALIATACHGESLFNGRNLDGWDGDPALWRVENGEMAGIDPRVVVMMAGTNDVGRTLPPDGTEAAARRVVWRRN